MSKRANKQNRVRAQLRPHKRDVYKTAPEPERKAK